ncbi:MAG: microcyclamide/patellamide family RiPP [Leptolyngbya sp. SIO1D8]|nr:microcyclamide/patellamide family RiPP [Leptolyngbya sp. SIO1D8]
MDKKNLIPNQSSPVSRITAGQLPPELAELAEETLCGHDGGGVVPMRFYKLTKHGNFLSSVMRMRMVS